MRRHHKTVLWQDLYTMIKMSAVVVENGGWWMMITTHDHYCVVHLPDSVVEMEGWCLYERHD